MSDSEFTPKPRSSGAKITVWLIIAGLILSIIGGVFASLFNQPEEQIILPGPDYYHEKPITEKPV